jgi:hypothetical protein
VCIGGKVRTIDPNTERAAPPLVKGPPLFFKDNNNSYCYKKDTYYIAPR